MDEQQGIYKDLRDRIMADEFPVGSALPGLRMLAAEYGRTTISIRHAVDLLKMEGIILSHHGKGNFIAKKPLDTRNVVLISYLEGHMFSDFVEKFVEIFSAQPGYNLILEKLPDEPGSGKHDKAAVELERLFQKLDAGIKGRTLDAIFFHALRTPLAKYLKTVSDSVNIYCFLGTGKLEGINCPGVMSDYFEGGRAGVRHLHDSGCRKLLLVTHRTDIYESSDPVHRFLEGCRAGAMELKLQTVEMAHQAERPDYAPRFLDIMRNHPDIDGIYACADYRLEAFYPALKELGRTVGKDIALLGYYDTPWAKMLNPQLSSVNVRHDVITKEVCRMYFERENHATQARINITPQIIARASSILS